MLTLNSAQLEHIRVHAKEFCLENPKVSSLLGARLNFLTNIMLYFVTQPPEEAWISSNLSWIVSVGFYDHQQATVPRPSPQEVCNEMLGFSKKKTFLDHIYFINIYLKATVFQPLAHATPRNVKVRAVYFHLFLPLNTSHGCPQTLLHVVLVHNGCSDSQLKKCAPQEKVSGAY